MNRFIDPNNTTVFVGGLANYVTEDELRSFFQGVGKITYVKIPPGKGCDYARFVWRHAAKMTIYQMQGRPIGNPLVRLSWGRSQSNSDAAGAPYRPAPWEFSILDGLQERQTLLNFDSFNGGYPHSCSRFKYQHLNSKHMLYFPGRVQYRQVKLRIHVSIYKCFITFHPSCSS